MYKHLSFKHGMYHISSSKAYIIIYLLSMAYIIKAKYQRKASSHMDTKNITWKPSDWGENHGSFTNFKNLLYQQLMEVATTPYNNFTSLLLEGATTPLYNHFNDYNPYTPTM